MTGIQVVSGSKNPQRLLISTPRSFSRQDETNRRYKTECLRPRPSMPLCPDVSGRRKQDRSWRQTRHCLAVRYSGRRMTRGSVPIPFRKARLPESADETGATRPSSAFAPISHNTAGAAAPAPLLRRKGRAPSAQFARLPDCTHVGLRSVQMQARGRPADAHDGCVGTRQRLNDRIAHLQPHHRPDAAGDRASIHLGRKALTINVDVSDHRVPRRQTRDRPVHPDIDGAKAGKAGKSHGALSGRATAITGLDRRARGRFGHPLDCILARTVVSLGNGRIRKHCQQQRRQRYLLQRRLIGSLFHRTKSPILFMTGGGSFIDRTGSTIRSASNPIVSWAHDDSAGGRDAVTGDTPGQMKSRRPVICGRIGYHRASVVRIVSARWGK